MSTGKVQECGCIALPEQLLQQTGLYPGATFEMDLAPDGLGILIHAIRKGKQAPLDEGAVCKTPTNLV